MLAFHPRPEELPERLPIFPLSGVLLLPHGKLPLNVFEPRYLAMVEDCLGTGRLLGMIQPVSDGPPRSDEAPAVFDRGCAGRVSSFAETEDGRFLITLTGLCRFRVAAEIDGTRGYRRIRPDWAPFLADLEEPVPPSIDRPRFLAALKAYCRLHNLDLNWKIIERAPDYELTVSMCMICPFEPREKQALLECDSVDSRAETLVTLMEMAIAAQRGGLGQLRQ